MKERVTLTIEQDILHKVDKTVDGTQIKNRSHAVELLLAQSFEKKPLTKALILAGGRPHGEEATPPHMVQVYGKPVLQHNIELLKQFGITDILLAVGYKADIVKSYFGDGSDFGVDITYIDEEQPLGTAGPIKKAKPYFNDTFIVCNGDELRELDINDMIEFHKHHKGKCTIALTTSKETASYGSVKVDGDKVKAFLGKTTESRTNLINSGFYIFEPEIIQHIGEGTVFLEQDIFPHLAEADELLAYHFSGKWMHVDDKHDVVFIEKEWSGQSQ